MSWLRSSPLRQSLTRSSSNGATNGQSSSSSSSHLALRQRPIDTATDCDPRACYDSFCKHWQQAYEIIQRSEPTRKAAPTHDDVLGVVSHLDFMVTLLLVELHHCNKIALPAANGAESMPSAPCLEFMLSENLLDKLYEWGILTGRYANAVRLEQLKLYELLVSHSRHQLLCHEPFLRPLLKILASSQGEIFPPDLEKRLVILLNQLCVVLMQNVHLLDLFFFSAAQEQYKQQAEGAKEQSSGESTTTTNFIIFSLLIPYVHREGSLGHQARDALLLCMALSQKNSNIGTYIAQYSSMCPLLVTGLGGLYSRLPNSIEITSIDWHRITPDDITDIPELMLFMNALEFCNAVVQVAHEMIKHQLLDFMYQGFIVPVLGPAILQTNIDSQISAMSYLDLILRSITEPELLRAFVKFLLDTEKFDGQRILDTLIERLRSTDPNLCMVTMALFDTLLYLNCEDLMLELVLKYLLPGKHIPISYRHKINKIDAYINVSEFFLELTPDVMKRAGELTRHKHVGETIHSNAGGVTKSAPPLPSPTSSMSKTIGANWNYYGVHSGDSLYSNFQAYLYEAHCKIEQCRRACAKWSNSYKYQKYPSKQQSSEKAAGQTIDLIMEFFEEFKIDALAKEAVTVAAATSSAAATHVTAATSSAQAASDSQAAAASDEKNKFDSLQSLGESSGYESFKWRPNEEETDVNETATPTQSVMVTSADAVDSTANDSVLKIESQKSIESTVAEPTATAEHESAGKKELESVSDNKSDLKLEQQMLSLNIGSESEKLIENWWRVSSNQNSLVLTDIDFSEDLFAQGTVSLGPFLNAIWGKLQTFTSNTMYVNLHLTGLITHLAWFPLPLLHSILLRPDIVITSDTPSFHQVLRILKQQIDAELPVIEDSLELIDVARSHLIDREFRLINARKNEVIAPLSALKPMQQQQQQQQQPQHQQQQRQQRFGLQSTYANLSSSSPVQVTPSSSYDPFRRHDTKRKSISKSITSIFSRKPNGSSQTSGGGGAGLTTASASAAQSSTPCAATQEKSLTRETSLSTMPIKSERLTAEQQQQASVAATTVNQASQPPSSSLSSISSSSTLTSVTTATLGAGGGGGGGGASGGISHGGGISVGGGNSEPVSLDSISSMGAIANTSGTERTRDLSLCAVLLDEWLKELAAIAQEQTLVLINDNI